MLSRDTGRRAAACFLVSIEEAKTSHIVTGIICKSKQIITFSRSALFSIYLFIAPAGFWPRRPKPKDSPWRSPRIRDENFVVAEKKSRFFKSRTCKGLPKVRWESNKSTPFYKKKAGAALVKTITSLFFYVKVCTRLDA